MLSIARPSILSRLLGRAATIALTFPRRPVRFFAYDEMMDRAHLGRLQVFPERSVVAFLDDHDVGPLAATREVGIGALSVFEKRGEKTWGVLHEISSFELVLLDFVAASCGYARRIVQVVDENGYEEPAWVFVARCGRRGLKLKRLWQENVVAACEAAELPRYYVDQIAALPTAVEREWEHGTKRTKGGPTPTSTQPLALSSGH
jgi:hypothetical protein